MQTSAAFERAHCRPSQPQLVGRIGPLSPCPSQSAGPAEPPPHRPPLRSLDPPAVSAAAGAANKAAVWAKPTAKKQKLASTGVPEVMSSAEVDRKLWHGASAAGWTGKRYGKARAAAYFSPPNHATGKPRAFKSAKDAKEAHYS